MLISIRFFCYQNIKLAFKCMVAKKYKTRSVVGLGKTVVGTLIAKKFFYSNDFPSHISNILIVLPPALKDNWVETLDKFQLQNYKIITSIVLNSSSTDLNKPKTSDSTFKSALNSFELVSL